MITVAERETLAFLHRWQGERHYTIVVNAPLGVSATEDAIKSLVDKGLVVSRDPVLLSEEGKSLAYYLGEPNKH